MSENNPITSWAEDDRPREKLILKGKNALSDAELIAILIGSGNKKESAVDLSKRILKDYENNLNALGKLELNQLMKYNGIGEAKAITIIAAMELGRRRRHEDSLEVKKIISSKIAFEYMQPILGDLIHEEFWCIYLNQSKTPVYKTQISKGGISNTIVDLRIIFKYALEYNAVSIVLVHNHPSGNLEPSKDDFKITRLIKNGAYTLNIEIIDHIIISQNNYYSFADQGEL
ncbi:MAG: RadC family protein [Flavobacterium sp.]|jgi:DNA repair protein RadC